MNRITHSDVAVTHAQVSDETTYCSAQSYLSNDHGETNDIMEWANGGAYLVLLCTEVSVFGFEYV
jgi:hypothetical protein